VLRDYLFAINLRVLCYFYQELLHFRLPELASLAEMFQIPLTVQTLSAEEESAQDPFLYLDFPNEEAVKAICSRSILIKSACASSYLFPILLALNDAQGLHRCVGRSTDAGLPVGCLASSPIRFRRMPHVPVHS